MKKILMFILKPFVAMTMALGCYFGIHSWLDGKCRYCGVKKP